MMREGVPHLDHKILKNVQKKERNMLDVSQQLNLPSIWKSFILINFGIQNSQLKKLISILSYVCKSYMRTDLGTDHSILNNQWNMFIVS